jgi:hypothetical protein
VYLATLHQLDGSRAETIARASSYVTAGHAIERLIEPDETAIASGPAHLVLYADRRLFGMPIRVDDLAVVERSIGGARLLVLRRSEVDDIAGYPDPGWRVAFGNDDIGAYHLIAVLGTGENETRIYRRP